MATENHSPPAPENGEEGGNRPRTHPNTTSDTLTAPKAAKGSRTSTIPTLPGIAAELRTVHQHITLVMSLVLVSTGALEAQNADNDIEVAMVLKRSVATLLYNQIE